MKSIHMSDDSRWQLTYREDTDDYELIIKEGNSEHIFYLNYSDMDEIIAKFAEEMNGE